jgi:putative MATE family efflux protein
LIARSVGAGDLERAKAVARQSTWISFIAGIFFGVVTMFFADPLLRIMGAAPDVLEAGIRYFRIVAVPSVFISQMVILGSILRAAGDTRTPMKVSLWVNIIHIGLGYVLIFGAPGLPGLGITGAAWATVIVRAAGATALFYSIRRSSLSFSLTEGMSFHTHGPY